MAANVLSTNIAFWHAPAIFIKGLTPDQLHWQPENHDTSIMFALWHAYRSSDDLVHGLLLRRPTVFASQGWASRLPVGETGRSAFGNGMTRDQIGSLRLDLPELCAYASAVGASINAGLDALTPEDAAAEIALPFFTDVYPGYDRMSRLEAVAFFGIGHVAEHLGEAQLVKGLMGLQGALL
jgi:hypothetical protein